MTTYKYRIYDRLARETISTNIPAIPGSKSLEI